MASETTNMREFANVFAIACEMRAREDAGFFVIPIPHARLETAR